MNRVYLWTVMLLVSATGSLLAQTARRGGPLDHRPLRFAVIGDYGEAGAEEAAVAALVHDFRPDLVLTVGDNNYPSGSAATIDSNIGQYYARYIHPYHGAYGPGAVTNRFFPSLGNHDWLTPNSQPYLDYFTLPGNERYYEVRTGPLHLFALDSDPKEPDGIDDTSAQALWLQNRLGTSTAPYRVVYFHHAPYSSASHGSELTLQWPFRTWGADIVLAGHDHVYERIEVDGLPVIVNGLGGRSRYAFSPAIFGSQARFNTADGAVLGTIDGGRMSLQFVTAAGIVVDSTTVVPDAVPPIQSDLVPLGATWTYLDSGIDPGANWVSTGYDDSGWASGSAQLGYGDGDEATVVDFGPDSSNKYITTYFRHVFRLARPSAIDALWLRAVRDDGIAIHLNGTEIFRSNLPAGAIDHRTTAVRAIGGNEEDELYGLELPAGALVAGPNLLAVEIHQVSGTSSDISFDLRLSAIQGRSVRLPLGSTWSYFDQGIDLGDAWRRPGYDDASWASGPAQLGYGDGDESTVLSYGPDANDKHPTTYLRHHFTVSAGERVQAARLRVLRDDGAIVYLNGEEVYRSNLKAGEVLYATYAGYTVSGDEEERIVETVIDPSLFVTGSNVLAVEVHQDRPASSDLSFDCELFTW